MSELCRANHQHAQVGVSSWATEPARRPGGVPGPMSEACRANHQHARVGVSSWATEPARCPGRVPGPMSEACRANHQHAQVGVSSWATEPDEAPRESAEMSVFPTGRLEAPDYAASIAGPSKSATSSPRAVRTGCRHGGRPRNPRRIQQRDRGPAQPGLEHEPDDREGSPGGCARRRHARPAGPARRNGRPATGGRSSGAHPPAPGRRRLPRGRPPRAIRCGRRGGGQGRHHRTDPVDPGDARGFDLRRLRRPHRRRTAGRDRRPRHRPAPGPTGAPALARADRRPHGRPAPPARTVPGRRPGPGRHPGRRERPAGHGAAVAIGRPAGTGRAGPDHTRRPGRRRHLPRLRGDHGDPPAAAQRAQRLVPAAGRAAGASGRRRGWATGGAGPAGQPPVRRPPATCSPRTGSTRPAPATTGRCRSCCRRRSRTGSRDRSRRRPESPRTLSA